MFSRRTPPDLEPNRLACALEHMRAAGRSFVDLTESNPTRAGFDYPEDLLAALSDPRSLVYAPAPFGAPDARAAVAAEYARRGLSVAPERIALTSSTSEAYSLLFKILCDPHDEVLVPRPSYPLFEHLARLDAIRAVPYDLEYHVRWSIDVASLERALSARTRAVLLVSPNNPTGSFVTPSELDRIAAIGARRQVALIADEVFADYELVPGAADASGHVARQDDLLAFSLGGLSKSIGLPQAKLAWIGISGRDDLVNDALRRLELACDTYLSVSTPVQTAAADLLQRGAGVRHQIQRRIAANLRSLVAGMAGLPACRVLEVEGGWYATVQVPSLVSEEDLAVDLLTRRGVLVHPGYFFDFARESFLIVSLLPPAAVFDDGLARLIGHFDCTASGA